MTKTVAITGGIGSGKSKIMHYIQSLGYPVYLSDQRAKDLMQKKDLIEKIQAIFEEKVVENLQLDRKKIAKIVFNNPTKLRELNNIIHPEVAKDFKKFVQKHKNQNIVFYESAILIESGNHKNFDYIVLITAPIEIRIQRVMKRDNTTKEQIIDRMKNQLPDEEKRKIANWEIENIDFDITCKKIDEVIRSIEK